ncbi:MAG: hypothetical protein HS128_14035 [Ideonella sp.]|nr:hypothetical protein [Ideonella sp.]MCC7457311.1 hypothetical protein [Nitrospira sp.]
MVRSLPFAASIAVVAIAAAALARAEFVPERKYEEVIDPATPVSGHAVVGAIVVPARQQDRQSDKLWVHVGKASLPSRIRVDVASASGRLHGEGTWVFKAGPNDKGPWYALTVPPKSTRPEPLAVGVQLAASADPATPTFLVAALSQSAPAAARQLRLFVNARGAEMFAYPPAGDAVKCEPVTQARTIRFDVTCDIDIPGGAQAGSAKVLLVRRDGNSTSRQPLELRW